MSNEVKIILTAVDKASATLKKVGDTGGLSMKALAVGGTAAVGVGIAIVKSLKDQADETVAYNLEVRNLAQNLGITTEATSRLIQTADDYGVAQETVTSALQMAVKKGFAPSINTIAQLADEYNSIEDPVKRAARMVEVFGRNWTALTPMLREGGDAIRKTYDSIDDSLVVTEESAKASREYQKALDNLNDSFQGIKYTVGNEVIPVLTDLINLINTGYESSMDFEDGINTLNNALAAHVITWDEFNAATEEAIRQGKVTYDMQMLLDKAIKGLNADNDQRVEGIRTQALANQELAAATEDANAATDNAPAVYGAAKDALEKANVPLAERNRLLGILAVRSGETTAQQQELERQARIITLAWEAGALSEKEYLQKLEDLKNGIPYAVTQVSNLTSGARDLDEATKGASDRVRGLKSSIDQLHDKTITIKVLMKTAGTRNMTGQGYGGASGLEMTVPSGYPNDSFGPFWASSNEHVSITKPGQKSGGGDGQSMAFQDNSVTINEFHNYSQAAAAITMSMAMNNRLNRLNDRMGG